MDKAEHGPLRCWEAFTKGGHAEVAVTDQPTERSMTTTIPRARRGLALLASAALVATTLLTTALVTTGPAVAPASARENLTWRTSTFGQSTDLNFASNVLPDKVGVNLARPSVPGTIEGEIFMESRGGKLAPGHDGLTFYYVELDATARNFVLSADMEVHQLGPETGANPNGQEGAGLMVRDVNGAPRQDPMLPGYEEYPAASNLAASVMLRNGPAAMVREGTTDPWGTVGSTRPVTAWGSGACVVVTGTTVSMTLERTDEAFVMSGAWTGTDGTDCTGSTTYPGADLVQVQDATTMAVGFFASRNVAVTFSHASLALSAAQTVPSPPRPEPVRALTFSNLSPEYSSTTDYRAAVRSTYPGTLSVRAAGRPVASDVPVEADAVAEVPVGLALGDNALALTFTPSEGPDTTPITREWNVAVRAFAGTDLVAAPGGTASGDGTEASPLDIQTAINHVAPGGSVLLAGGTYDVTDTIRIGPAHRGREGALKTLAPLGDAEVILDGQYRSNVSRVVLLEADWWRVEGFRVTGSSSNGLRIQGGSHNVIADMTFNFNRDSGFQMSGSGSDSALWPAHNLVVNSTSHDNRDLSDINADGFAAKLGVGPGNVFRGNVAHHNIDDGWDLYNRLNEGANFPIVLEGNIAHSNGKLSDGYNADGNTGNGFKLGGEGLPVAHAVVGNLAFDNNMDGFSDNFNPGRMSVTNNTAIENGRYNVLFRSSPYFADADQAVLRNVLSLSVGDGRPELADAAAADRDASNYLWNGTATVNSAGRAATPDEFLSLQRPPGYGRDADGAIAWGDYTRPRLGSFLAGAGAGGMYVGALAPGETPVAPFVDVPVGAQFFTEISWFKDSGLTTGWPDGTFRPTQPVARDAMVAFLYRLAGSPSVAGWTEPFTDVHPDQEHYDAIVWAAHEGVTTGWPDGSFKAVAPIERNAMMAFMYRYSGSPSYTVPVESPFSDVGPGDPFFAEIMWAYEHGITTGYGDGAFRPHAPTNRDATAAFFHRFVVDNGFSMNSEADR